LIGDNRLNAVRIHAAGAIDALRYEDCEEPQLERPTDVIVKLVATAVNRLDLELRAGANGRFSFPHILGCDGAGRIEALGAEVRHLNPGDPVCVYPFVHCGSCQFCAVKEYDRCADRRILSQCEDGTYAEYITVPAKSCFPIPFGFSFEEAAAFPLVYTTAWRLMMTQGKLIPGEIVLIRGVGGGIATAACQIAASAGARIIVSSAKDEKLARAKALGFEPAINDDAVDLAKEVRGLTAKHGVDLAVDCIGGSDWGKSLACLARGGRLVTCGAIAGANPPTDLRRIFWNHLKICGATYPTRDEFRQVLMFFDYSRVKPIIDIVYALREAAQAHRRMEQRRHFGKIVLRTDG
jgi:NADPH:quinone reductase-like Zn-dependent oxidoreductase